MGDCAEVKNNSFKIERVSKALLFYPRSIAPGHGLFRSYYQGLTYSKVNFTNIYVKAVRGKYR
jgi:hypothetical protein